MALVKRSQTFLSLVVALILVLGVTTSAGARKRRQVDNSLYPELEGVFDSAHEAAWDQVGNKEKDAEVDDAKSSGEYLPGGPYVFTVTSSDVGSTWEQLPFREKYKWSDTSAPCHPFQLQVPDERVNDAKITLCIFRPFLEFPDDTEQFIAASSPGGSEEEPEMVGEQKELKVLGFVKGENGSKVYGRMIGTTFYGEVSIYSEETKTDEIYVVEEIKLLKRLMRYNEKVLRNILTVMSHKRTGKFNAVVTRDASLLNFMASVNPSEFVRGSFLVFSTSRNSYITAGEPQMEIDEDGKITFNAGGDKIVIDNESHSSIRLITGNDREYIFRPNGRTIVQNGLNVQVLEEQEGAVAVSAFTSESGYGCVLPTHAFDKQRNGGYLCKICVIVDKTFRSEYVEKLTPPTTTIPFVGSVLDSVSWIFRSTDWNDDGTPDNVGLDYDPIYDTWIPDIDPGNNTLSEQELDILFGDLAAKDFSDCCVALAFTMKHFPSRVLAVSSPGKEKRVTAAGGVCGGIDQAGLSNNVVLISANNKAGFGQGGVLTKEQLTALTAQQLGRAFGANYNGIGEDSCDFFNDDSGVERHYIMWPEVTRNMTQTEKQFSKCSKNQISRVLSSCKSACFDVDKHPFCGNGIVEVGEECDCGSDIACGKQTCCYSRIGEHPCRKTGVGCSDATAVYLPAAVMVATFLIHVAIKSTLT